MQVGVTLRNMGPESTPALMAECARAAEALAFESLWITDHIAIPPDDAEGSGGRYVDPLVTLAWMAGFTQRIRLGTGVIVLPYRPALPFARQVAALQELSEGRLLLGVGVGWMAAEFRAVGADLHTRGKQSDDVLAFLNRCFTDDHVEAHGQPFLFRPRPAKPPVLIGGRAPHALERAARFGDGWLPMARGPEEVRPHLERYRDLTQRRGRSAGTVSVISRLELGDAGLALQQLREWQALGVDRFVCAIRYATAAAYRLQLETLARCIEP